MMAKIYRFPKGKKAVPPEQPAPPAKPATVKGPPKVLLIAEDDGLRELLEEALTTGGCEVTPHKFDHRHYPALLLEQFEKVRFDVVIPTNLGIPFVFVPDLVSLAQKFAKGAGILVISGWVEDDFIAELAKIPRTAFLKAPMNLEELVLNVKELAKPLCGSDQ